jgi:hypothetical protein
VVDVRANDVEKPLLLPGGGGERVRDEEDPGLAPPERGHRAHVLEVGRQEIAL